MDYQQESVEIQTRPQFQTEQFTQFRLLKQSETTNDILTKSKESIMDQIDETNQDQLAESDGISKSEIKILEQKAKKLIASSKYIAAFKCIQQVINFKTTQAQDKADKTLIVQYVVETSKFFNQFGMDLLNHQHHKECQRLFVEVLNLLKRFQGKEIHNLIGLTLNNLSCSYKRNGQIEEAQKALTKALEFQAPTLDDEQDDQNFANPRFDRSPDNSKTNDKNRFLSSPRQNECALTELNLCAIYSQKGDHMKAKMYVHSSIYKLTQELDYLKNKIEDLESRDANVSDELLDNTREKQSLLAIAHYNLGSQQEFLKEFHKALESYLMAHKLEKSKNKYSSSKKIPPSPLIAEFLKSYKDMKRKIQMESSKPQKHSNTISQNFGKRTFSGLPQNIVDQQTGTGSNTMSQFYNGVKKIDQGSLAKYSSKASFNPSYAHNQITKIEKSPRLRQRPQSAKNPTMKPRFTRNETSTPLMVGDDIINIQQEQVIDEEEFNSVPQNDYAMKDYDKSLEQHTFNDKNERPKVRRIRPVSSYVKKSNENLNRYKLKKSSIQNINIPSEQQSNVDSQSNFKRNHLKSNFMNQRTSKNTIARTGFFNPYASNDDHILEQSDELFNHQYQMIQRPLGINECQSRQSKMTSSLAYKNQTLTTNGEKKVRPSSSKTYMSISSKHKLRPSFAANSIKSLRPPTIPTHKKNFHLKRPSEKIKVLKNCIVQPTEGDRLINAIDKGFEFLKSQDTQKVTNQKDDAGSMGDVYAQEIIKQSEYLNNNNKLSSDIDQFSKSQQKLLESIKYKDKLIKNKRPSTAKDARGSQVVSINENHNKIQQIDEQYENEKSPRDYEKEIYENLGIPHDFGQNQQLEQRYSVSRSRSRSKSKGSKQLKSKRARPHSAYPQQEKFIVNLNNINKIQDYEEDNYTNKQVLKKPKNPNRIQSAGAQRIVNQNEKDESPYRECKKRVRPDNHPKNVLQESSRNDLDLIGELESNSDTQMIYSGTISRSRQDINNSKEIERENSQDLQLRESVVQQEANMFSSQTSFQQQQKHDQDIIQDNYHVDFQREDTNTAEFQESLKKPKSNSSLHEVKSLKKSNKKTSSSYDKKKCSKDLKAQQKAVKCRIYKTQSQPILNQNTNLRKSSSSKIKEAAQNYSMRRKNAGPEINTDSNSLLKSLKKAANTSKNSHLVEQLHSRNSKKSMTISAKNNNEKQKMIESKSKTESSEKESKQKAEDEVAYSEEENLPKLLDEQISEIAQVPHEEHEVEIIDFNQKAIDSKAADNYQTFLTYKMSQAILEKFYNPEQYIKNKQKEIEIQIQQVIQEKYKQALLKVMTGKQKDSQEISIEDEKEEKTNGKIEQLKDTGVLDDILTGQNQFMKIPISEDDSEMLNNDRAAAIGKCYDSYKLQLDQCAYNSKIFGLCQLVFVFRPNSHSLQILLFQAKNTNEETEKNLKVNREINLLKFKIEKPMKYGQDNDMHFQEKEQEKIRERHKQKDDQARCIVALKVIQAIKEIKANLSGDIYQDFYQSGEPGSENIDYDKFQVHVESKDVLQQEINQILTDKIQFNFHRSKNFQKFNQKFTQEIQKKIDTRSKQVVPKVISIFRIIQAVRLIQRSIRNLFLRREQRMLDHAKAQLIEEGLKFEKFYTYQSAFFLEKYKDGKIHPEKIFIRVVIKVNGDKSNLQVEGYDLNPNKKLKYEIDEQQVIINPKSFQIMQENLEFIKSHIQMKFDKLTDKIIYFDLRDICKIQKKVQQIKEFKQKSLETLVNSHSLFDELNNSKTSIVPLSNNHETPLRNKDAQELWSELIKKPLSKQELLAAEQLQCCLYTPEQKKEIEAHYIKQTLTKATKHKLARQIIGNFKGQHMSAAKKQLEQDTDRYQAIFKGRKEIKQYTEPFWEYEKVKKDDNMWAHDVQNMTDYAILKIQKWWRRRATKRIFNLVIENNKKVRNQFNSVSMFDKIAKIELELEIIKNEKQIARSKIDEQSQIQLIISCQRRYRLKSMIKKVRDRQKGNNLQEPILILYKQSKDFIEDLDAIYPSNYTISVNKYEMTKQKKIFNIDLKLNNKPEKELQFIRIFHDISYDYDEQKLLQKNQTNYFENLVMKRIVFERDSVQTIRQRQDKADWEQKYRNMRNFDITNFGMYSNHDQNAQNIKEVPVGKFKILSLNELIIIEKEHLNRNKEYSDIDEERSDFYQDQEEEKYYNNVMNRQENTDLGIIDIGEQQLISKEQEQMLNQFEGGSQIKSIISIGSKFNLQ